MKHFKYVFLSACTAATLVVGSLSAYAAPKVATLPIASVQSSEVKEALAQNWIPNALQEKAGSYSAVTEKDFNDALFAASKAAGASLDITFSLAEESLSREKAASLLDKIINVPYAKKFGYNDIPLNSPYESSILNVRQAELMNGISSQSFGYGQPLTNEDAAVLAYRVYKYLLPFTLPEASITEMQKAMESGRLTSEELVQQYLTRIEKYDDKGPALNAILTLNPEAIHIAKALDAERAERGPRGPLHGIPIIVKDNIDTVDMPTTSGCICLEGAMAPDDAAQVKKLKDAGAIILAKSNLHEFAFGYTTVSSLGGQTLNPYDLTRVPGGSSGGTGAAIAANFAAVGLGTDTGGSIRVPSSFNSLVGIRPTVGLSSVDGIAPLAHAQDTGGPIARSVEDAALILNATAGYDPNDVSTAKSVGFVPEDYTAYLDKEGLKGARIGIVREVFGTNPEVNKVMNQAIEDMKKAGAIIVDDVKIPNFAEINKYGSLSAWEFKFNFNDYLNSLGAEAPFHSLDDIIKSGKYHPSNEQMLKQRNSRESLNSEEYKDILLYRTKLAQEAVLKMMADNQLEALIFPTSANPPVKIDNTQMKEYQNIGEGFKLSTFTFWPTVTVPAGFTSDGLPVGVDFFGRAFSEATLLKLAYSFEQNTHHRKAPEMTP
ncbi:amidase family protein [Paenibacillus sp. tmac-D7]|uniref:amidase family protein n=1 Tax=Paenibacillus sp. tmac-D7 TaxID=2591462 RepID=UPI00215B0519|nr:amidase family protein [Paenibacillus sp. tmac-D7]